MHRLLTGALLFIVIFPLAAQAQEVHRELQETVPAIVVEVVSERQRSIAGTEAVSTVQTVRARIEEGVRAGDVVTFESDLVMLQEEDQIFLNRLQRVDGSEYYQIKDFDRRGALLTLFVIFLGLLVFFARWHGLRAAVSLLISIAAIFFVLIPALLHGYPPVVTSVGIAGVILAIVIFLTHGFRPHTCIAFAGTLGAVVATALVAETWVTLARLTGFGSDAAVYLNLNTHGTLDFGGLLLGGMIIGVLGVLDDVAITQASVVQELKRANKRLHFAELYRRALRVGRDHIGSLVNTLAFAYIGVSLPLVMLFASADAAFDLVLNQEIIAAELVRILVGSIGLILAVPFTTVLAAWWFSKREVPEEEAGHPHAH